MSCQTKRMTAATLAATSAAATLAATTTAATLAATTTATLAATTTTATLAATYAATSATTALEQVLYRSSSFCIQYFLT